MRSFRTSAGSQIFFHDLPGEGTPLVFIHGLGCASSCDYPQVAASQALGGHRRILVDLPGFGFSDKSPEHDYSLETQARSLHELIVHLDLNPPNLFGHSMGGAIAIALASRLGDRVGALVISEGNLDAGGGPTSRKIAGFSREEYGTSGHLRLVEENRAAGNGHWAASLQMSSPKAVHQGASDLVRGSTPSWRQQLYGFAFPRTYLFGEKNLPDDKGDELTSRGIAVRVVARAGHNMASENPEGLAQRIKEAMSLDVAQGSAPGW